MWEADQKGQGYVFSTAGDAFAAAFPTAEGSLAAAVRAQLELLAADWPGPPIRVRMGIHTGSADERDGDYFGPVIGHWGVMDMAAMMTQLGVGGPPA